MNKSGKREDKNAVSLIENSAVGAIIGLLVTFAALLPVSALMVEKVLPVAMSDAFTLASVIIGTTFGGVHCARRQGRGVIIAGLAASGVYVLLVFLGTLLFMKRGAEAPLTLKIIIAAVAGGCFGGTLKLGRRTKKSRLRRKYN